MTFTLILASFLGAQPAPIAQTAPAQQTASNQNAAPAPQAEPVNVAVAVKSKDDPNAVRCKSEKIIGSRAKRKRTCMTNKEWALVEQRGNDATREFARDNFASGL